MDNEPERPLDMTDLHRTKDRLKTATHRYQGLKDSCNATSGKLQTARDKQKDYMDSLAKLQVIPSVNLMVKVIIYSIIVVLNIKAQYTI